MTKITSDIMASELISMSLSMNLTNEEKEALDRYVSEKQEAKSFSELSSLIHKSVTDRSQAELDDAAESGADVRLSEIAKERLRKSIRKAKLESAKLESMSPSEYAARVAERETTYFNALGKDTDGEVLEESRQAVSRFTLIHKIGEGGLGTVWLARDEKLRRNVAIKEMSPNAAGSKKLYRRFQREAEITGHLEHPNVVPLYMSGVNPDTGLPFYAMRFLGKRTLAEAIREYHARREAGVDEPIDLHRLLNAFLDVCQAIAFAHSRGVVHRDLKPENVALDNFGQVLVLDWGLAKLDGDGELAMRLALSGVPGDSHLGQTLDGDVVGTPLYMAPEQAAGNMAEMEARTDVYGLGAILFAILTGQAPHENSHRSSSGTLKVQDFLNSIVASETPRARDLNPQVPRDLEAICARAMAKEKFARHASATELANDVEKWIAGKHDKETRYEALRLNARDLKSRLCVQVRQMAAAGQFMVELPPIQGLLRSVDSDMDEYATWRERLTQILLALAKAKPNVSALSYSQIAGEHVKELVRVERSTQDVSNVRAVPQSRLRKGAANTFHQIVMQLFPGESSMDFDCQTAGTVRLVCGVPVFDSSTEEPFGLVSVEAEIGNLIKPELDVIGVQGPVYLIDDRDGLLHVFGAPERHKELRADELIDNWQAVTQALNNGEEYVDADREFYATQLMFPQKNNSIRIVMRVPDHA